VWSGYCLVFGLAGLHVATVLLDVGLAALQLAWVSKILDMLVRVLFMLGLAGLHVARAVSEVGLVALHLACALFNCCWGIVLF